MICLFIVYWVHLLLELTMEIVFVYRNIFLLCMCWSMAHSGYNQNRVFLGIGCVMNGYVYF